MQAALTILPFSDAYTCGSSGHYSRPVDPRLDPSCAGPAQAQLNSITKILTHGNGVDSEQWPPTATMQYSAVYVPTSNNLVESSFSTTSTSDQALPNHYHRGGHHSSSLSSSGGGGGGRRKNTSRCKHRRSRNPPPAVSSNTRTISSSCSCSSCSSCPEDNTSLMHAVPIAKKNGECSPPPLLPSSAVVNGQDSDLLWQGGHRVCTMQNNHPAASNGSVIDGFSSATNADAQSRQSWHKNVVVQQAEGNGSNGGIFSSLWRKRSRTTQNQRLANNKRNPRSPRHAASMEAAAAATSITKTGNQQHAWMTLRVPTTGAGHLGNMHQQPPNPVGFRQSQPQPPAHLGQPAIMVVQSKTLGRQPNNNNVNGHIVMPNPDDILPKEAWTDFSGNDEWPRFSGIVSAAAAAADRKSASALTSDNNNSSTRLYVNCPSSSSSRVVQRGLISDSKDDEDADQDAANGNRENSLNSALNGLRPPPSPAAMTSALVTTVDNDDNEGQQHSWNENFSQQIENNLMASSVSRGAVGVGEGGLRDSKKPTAAAVGISEDNSSQGHVRSEIRSKPPVPPPRNCISHQRKTRTKKQQSKGLHYLASEETNGSGGGRHGRRGHHANDEKSSSGGSSSDSADDSQDESDNDLEQSLLFQQPPPDSSSQWHQSPLLQ